MLRHIAARRDRVILVLAGLFLVVAAVVALASTATRIGRPTPGFITWQNLAVPAVTGSGDAAAAVPLRSVLEAVDGVPVASAAELHERLGQAPVGREFAYTFRHHDERTTVTLPTRLLGWGEMLPVVVPFLLNGLVLGVTSLVVFYFRPRLRAARAFLALGVTFGGMLLLALDAFAAAWLQRLCFTLDSLVPAALLHFALCFPEERAVVRRWPALEWLVYLPGLVLAALQNWFLGRSAAAHLAVSDVVYGADAAAAIVAIASLVYTFRRSGSAVARQQAKAVAAGFAVASFVPAIAILNVVLLDANIPFNPLAIFLLVCPVSIGWAIARHNLFEVDRFLRLGVVYGALSLLVFAAYAGLVVAGEWIVGAGAPLPAEVGALYIVAVLLLANPLRVRVQEAVDRLFYRQSYSYRGAVEHTSRRLASLLGTRDITGSVLHVVTDVMAIGSGALFVLRDDGIEAWGSPAAVDARARIAAAGSGAAIRALAARPRPVTAYEIGRRAADGDARSTAAVELARSLDVFLFVPLRFQDAPVGLLCAGEKLSGAFYSDEDLHLLETLANQAALALENARAYEALTRTQASLVEAERLAAVGELAATLAHGIRNPLAGIRMAAQVAQDDPADSATVGESLADIVSETERLEMRVRGLLDITRPANDRPETTDLGSLVRGFAAEVAARIPPAMQVETHVAADVPAVRIDPPRLREVLDVLVNNAVEALGGSGSLTIDVTPQPRGAAITVRDDGPGIPAEVVGRIFDLFFTTKSSGTGVGLAMAKRLIERQGGTLQVESEPGRGTTFTIELPGDAS